MFLVRSMTVIMGALLVAQASAIPGAAQTRAALPERFTAVAVSPGGPRSQSIAAQVEIRINR